MRPIPALYIPVPSPFPLLESFIADSGKRYNLDLFLCNGQSERVEGVVTPIPVSGNDHAIPQTQRPRAIGKTKGPEGMRQALERYKSWFPHINAILVGTRRSDPRGGVYLFFYIPKNGHSHYT